MRTLFFECNMGAAGDMLVASLIELLPNPDVFIQKIDSLGIPSVKLSIIPANKCGIFGTSFSVQINGAHEEHYHHHLHHHEEHAHNKLTDISRLINGLQVSNFVKEHALAIYSIIAEAEAKVHQKTVELVYFHEVGAIDAVCDIISCCMLIEMLNPDVILSSPIAVGSGFVHCAHGILPVPAPATAEILRGVPIYSGEIKSELCTPTGAAILKHFAQDFVSMPTLKVEKIGYGCGKKDFEVANCVRAYFAEQNESEDVVEIICNIDDMTAEALSFATEILLKNGALDVFTLPIFMKKNRQAVLLTALTNLKDKDKIIKLILKNTTTFGVRQKICKREVLNVRKEIIRTMYGEITIKIGQENDIIKFKPEYDDVAKAALSYGVSFDEVYKCAIKNFKLK